MSAVFRLLPASRYKTSQVLPKHSISSQYRDFGDDRCRWHSVWSAACHSGARNAFSCGSVLFSFCSIRATYDMPAGELQQTMWLRAVKRYI